MGYTEERRLVTVAKGVGVLALLIAVGQVRRRFIITSGPGVGHGVVLSGFVRRSGSLCLHRWGLIHN